MTTDPFEELRAPVAPLAPRPAFARELHRRLIAELRPDPEVTTMPILEVREYTPARLHVRQARPADVARAGNAAEAGRAALMRRSSLPSGRCRRTLAA